MSRYLVTVKAPDDHPAAVRVFGPWRVYESACEFAAKVNSEVEAREENGTIAEASGWAYVHLLNAPRIRKAQAWATEGIEP